MNVTAKWNASHLRVLWQGLLFILVRRPFQIGDGISVSDINEYNISAGRYVCSVFVSVFLFTHSTVNLHVRSFRIAILRQISPFWIVEDVDLFTTKVRYFRSGERATLNNGSLANSRVINATLSKLPTVSVSLKFPLSVSYEKLQVFHQALEQYFKNRPREWGALLMFALTNM